MKNIVKLFKVFLLILIVGVFLGSQVVFGAARTASVSGNWSNTTTWGGASVPVAGDDVTINNNITVTVTADAACSSITFGAGANASSLVINSGFTLTVSGNITYVNPAAAVNKLINVGDGVLICNGNLAMQNNSSSGVNELRINNGTATIGGTITTAGSAAAENVVNITGNGTLNVNAWTNTNCTFTPTGVGCTVKWMGDNTNFVTASYQNLIIQLPATATADRTRTLGAALTVAGNLTIESLHATFKAILDPASQNFTVIQTIINQRGRINDSNNNGTNTFTGKVNVNANGEFNTNSVTTAGRMLLNGGIENNNTTAASCVMNVCNFGATQTVGGSGPIDFNRAVLINGNFVVTNSNTNVVNMPGSLDGTVGGSTWTNAANSYLKYGSGTNMFNSNNGALIATANPNTVEYNRSANSQTIKAFTGYHHLIVSNGNTKSLAAAATVNVAGNLTIDGAVATTLSLVDANLTVTGTTTIALTSTLNDGTVGGTNTFVGRVTNNGIWNITAAAPFIFRNGITNNGTAWTSNSGAYTFNTNNQTIDGTSNTSITNVTLTAVTLTNNITTGTGLTIAGQVTGSGVGKLTNGVGAILTISGAIADLVTGCATCTVDFSTNSNTVSYTNTASLAVNGLAPTYWNLKFSNNNTRTLVGNTTVKEDFTGLSGTLATTATNYNLIVNRHFSYAGTTPTGGGKIQLTGGTVQHQINTAVSMVNLELNDANGAILMAPLTINGSGTLTLTNGIFTLNGNNLTVQNTTAAAGFAGTYSNSTFVATDATASIIRTFTAINTYVFPVGTGTNEYSPLQLLTGGTAGGSTITIAAVKGIHPNNPSGTDYLNRYWKIATSNTNSMTATCTYTPATDIVGVEGQSVGARWNGTAWIKNVTNLSGGSLVVGPTNFGTAPAITALTGVDNTAPTISNLHFYANNPFTNGTTVNTDARTGSPLTVTFTASEPVVLSGYWITAVGKSISTTSTNLGLNYTISYTLDGSEATSPPALLFSANIVDYYGLPYATNPLTQAATADAINYDKTAPTNANCVLASNSSVPGGGNVTIAASSSCGGGGAASDEVWFAPAIPVLTDAALFIEGATMTRTTGGSTTIVAPATANTYKIYVIDKSGNVSAPSTAVLTQAPTIDNVNAAGPTFVENGAAINVSSTFTPSSASGTLASASIYFTGGYVSGSDFLACGTPGGLTFTFAAGMAKLTGAATIATYQTAVQSITFNNTQHPPVNGSTRTIAFVINDGTSLSTVVSTVITVSKFITAPTFTSSPVTVAQEWNNFTYNITFADDVVATASVSLTTNPGWLTLTSTGAGTATLTAVAPFSGARTSTVLLTLTDADLATATQSFTISVAQQFNVPGDAATIQAGIDLPAAITGDLIKVASGSYTENIDFKGKSIEVRGDITTPANVVIDGNQNGSVVTFKSGETNSAVLNGFTVRNGSGTLANPGLSLHDGAGYYGGGIYILSSSPVIKNCVIQNNTVAANGNFGGSGGGVYAGGGSPQFMSTTIKNNTAQIYRGGGMCIENTSAAVNLDAININNNSGGNYGGGIAAFNATITITNTGNLIQTNAVSGVNGLGGGIFLLNSSLNTVNTTISGNSATIKGKGILRSGSSLTFGGTNTDGTDVLP